VGIFELGGQNGFEVGKDVKLSVQGVGDVEVEIVVSRPAECLTVGDNLYAAEVYVSGLQKFKMFVGEIIAYNTDELNRGKE